MRHDAKPVISFRRSGGGSFTLGAAESDASVTLIRGAEGLGAPPVSFSTSPRLGGHGSVLSGKRLEEREPFIPVRMEAPTMSELSTVREELLQFLSPVDDRTLWLQVAVPGRDGYREIPVHYAGGLEANDNDEYHGTYENRGIRFRSMEALWYGEVKLPEFQVEPARKPLLSEDSFFPVELSDSTVDGEMDVVVAGDAPTAPWVMVYPPGDSFSITHQGTGETFTMEDLITGPVTINMGTGLITGATWNRVTQDSRIFNLQPGLNRLSVVMPGATADSLVRLRYFPRYLAGY